jgi:glutamate dehydrogenase
MPSEEWRTLDTAVLERSCAAQSEFGRIRRPGQTLLRVLPGPDSEGGSTPDDGGNVSVIELITEDMPFLVDTVQLCVAATGGSVQLLIHPILRVRRDARGSLRALQLHRADRAAERGAEASGAQVALESWQHVQIDALAGEAECTALERQLRAALADLRKACRDWQRMRQTTLQLCADIERHPPPLPPEVVSESRALLEYMEANHFTFLGIRASRLSSGRGGPTLVPVRQSALGILRRRRSRTREVGVPAATIRRALRSHELLVITKANTRSTVHRAGYLDYVGVKRFDAHGRTIGETRIVGLWTSSAYRDDPRQIPWLRLKLRQVIEHFPFTPDSHDGKRLITILESLPRDELFQASVSDLVRCLRPILPLEARSRVRLILRRDEFQRFWSCLLFVPRERLDALAQTRVEALLRTALRAQDVVSSLSVGDAPLAQLHVVAWVDPAASPQRPNVGRLEREIAAVLIGWRDRLREALRARFGRSAGLELERRYGGSFPDSYREDVGAQLAVDDIEDLESLEQAPERMQLRLYRPAGQPRERVHLRIVRRGETLSVSEVLPSFEHFDLRVIAERPYRLTWPDGSAVWIQDFELEHFDRRPIALPRIAAELIAAYRAVRAGQLEDDGFNRLIIGAELRARQVMVLRTCCRYLLQTGITFSQSYMERVLAAHPTTARELVALFEQRLTSTPTRAATTAARELEQRVRRAIGNVTSADEDRILRAFLAVVLATTRTNYFLRGAGGLPRTELSIKLDPTRIPGLPAPRPAFEIFMHSPRLEGVHLRKGAIARGGIRWSERPEDFRTEILGLMKAQHVKNTLIVPVGAKGGFVARRLPPRAPRDQVQREVTESYRAFIEALLELTDNITQGRITAPPEVRRLDGDDPYLVVAADKGTATFSDVANEIALEHRFWLGDAFASGGSSGYDHKKMGITARGAFECIKRHFRELGRDLEREPISVVGIGDMSGDVFGNGLLQSRQLRLVGAFNHQHIFIDPSPDPQRSYRERERLFRLPRSGWSDYRSSVLSRGGAVYERSAKRITLSREAQQLLALPERSATPVEIVRALLCLPVDLLFNGGIGTYVKASSERHGDIGDRANDAVRVNGREVRACVVGEGGNLGFSQLGRIEYALHGGRLNTDFIDNSAGVNTSDVEVNLKILLDASDGPPVPRARRNRLLASCTDEVAQLVLRNNYLQSQAISLMELRAVADLGEHQRLLRWLERHGDLDRAVEFLPSDEALKERRRQGRGLTRPELALLLAYGKIALNHALTEAGGASEPYLALELQRYFPVALRRRYAERIEHHRLRTQIIITAITNSLVNRVGPALLMQCVEQTGADAVALARAYTIARDSTELRARWTEIESLDGQVRTADQYQALQMTADYLRHLTLWLVRRRRQYADVGAAVAQLQPALRELAHLIPSVLEGLDRERYQQRRQRQLEQGFAPRLADYLAALEALQVAPDLTELAANTGSTARAVAQAHFALSARLSLDWLHAAIEQLPASGDWQQAAKARLADTLLATHLRLSAMVLTYRGAARAGAAAPSPPLQRWQQLLAELRTLPSADFAALTVAVQALSTLATECAPQALAQL